MAGEWENTQNRSQHLGAYGASWRAWRPLSYAPFNVGLDLAPLSN